MNTIRISLIFALFLNIAFFSTATYAKDTLSAGQAVTLCKNEVAEQYQNFERSKASNIKDLRSGFRIKLKIYLTEESFSADCAVSKDGVLTIEKS